MFHLPYKVLERNQQIKQDIDSNSSQLTGQNPSNLLTNPVVDIELTQIDDKVGFTITRDPDAENGRLYIDSIKSKWEELLGEIKFTLQTLSGVEYKHDPYYSNSITIMPKTKGIEGYNAIINAFETIRKGKKVKELLYQKNVNSVSEQLKGILMQQRKTNVENALRLFLTKYNFAYDTWERILSLLVANDRQQLIDEFGYYNKQCDKVFKKYDMYLNSIINWTQQEYEECLRALTEKILQSNLIISQFNDFVSEIKKPLVNPILVSTNPHTTFGSKQPTQQSIEEQPIVQEYKEQTEQGNQKEQAETETLYHELRSKL